MLGTALLQAVRKFTMSTIHMHCRYAARLAARREAAAKASSDTTATGQPDLPKDVADDQHDMHHVPKEEV